MADYKLDKTKFKMMTFKEADKNNIYEKQISYTERLRQAYFLILQAYGFSMDDQPTLDRQHFSCKKME